MQAQKPEDMTDEQLVEPREITTCVEVDDAWECTLSCGHEILFVTIPPMKLQGCAQCVHILVDRRKKNAR